MASLPVPLKGAKRGKETMDMPRSDRGTSQSNKGELCQADRKEKAKLPDGDCPNTGQSRKYVMRKIHRTVVKHGRSKKRKEIYDGQVKAALAKIREVVDHP